jgi:hypothetical protein
MATKPKDLPVPVLPSAPAGMEVSEYTIGYRRAEDEQEKAQRLHKERVNFYFKDIGTYLFGLLFLSVITIYCFWALFDKTTTPEERRYVWAAISAVMGGIVGTFFGRSTK